MKANERRVRKLEDATTGGKELGPLIIVTLLPGDQRTAAEAIAEKAKQMGVDPNHPTAVNVVLCGAENARQP